MKINQLLSATALAGIVAAFPVIASAQTAPATKQDKPEAQPEEDSAKNDAVITVTGSRIARPEYSGVLPGVQISGEFVQERGFTSVLEALNDNPLIGPGASPLGTNGGQAASLGASFVDLLDLGTNRTLTLVNGRRFVSGNAATLFVQGNTSGGQVDLNSIPSTLVERIDVLTVAGAAAYGSDAISGVINLILKDKFEGTEVGVLAGITEQGDGARYQVRGLIGRNFFGDRLNVTASAEYTREDGLQADAREFQLRRGSTLTNFANGGVRNPAFASAIIDSTNLNNGAFLRNSDDGIPSNGFGFNLVNITQSFNGTILNLNSQPTAVPYVANAQNFISFQNGLTPTNGAPTQIGTAFFNTAVQQVNGLPGVSLAIGAVSGNGRNGAAAAIPGLPITTFAPTALPAGVTAAQVFTQFGITPPAGSTAAQQSTLAINVLQANRPTQREFFAANPNVPINYFLGTFIPGLPRRANTDTTLVTVAGVRVPVNQVLPFVAVPLEFNADGSIREFVASTLRPDQQGTISQSPGSDTSNLQALRNGVLRSQQDRLVFNLNANFELTPDITLFTENLYARTDTVSLRNGASGNTVSASVENSALNINVNNPFLTAGNLASLSAVGIGTGAGQVQNFAVTRTNQDIFGDNPNRNLANTFRLVGGARAKFKLLGKDWNAEISGTYGEARQSTYTTQILDIEYQLALDVVRDAGGQIRCRSQLFPAQYLGRTPTGTVANLTRLPGAGGIPTEIVVTPTITQAQIDACQPLNPFGYNQMSDASKAYVRQDVLFQNTSTQTFLQGSVGGGIFDLPAGLFSLNASIEYRHESLNFSSDALNQLGRGRAAPSANTIGSISVIEGGVEARVPIFSEKFLPFLGNLEINPAFRVSQQNGQSPTFRNLAGNLVTPTSSGDPSIIYSFAGTWQPIPVTDLTFRGNYTRSIRQPSVVELFLGGQPSFAVTTDPCGPNLIDNGTSGATRRANCRTALISLGIAANAAAADTFLATYVPNNISLPGSFAGAPGLSPERAVSWTVGANYTPSYIPGLSLSVDYFNVDLANQIQPTNPTQALNFCYESQTFPDTSPQTGSNTCNFVTRNAADFQIAPGFASGFINLAATQLRAYNITGRYSFDLPRQLGKFTVRSAAYHLVTYDTSANGAFTDVIRSAGTAARPQWEVQTTLRYQKGKFFTQGTWNWNDRTRFFSGGQPATIEFVPEIDIPSVNTYDIVIGADVSDKFRIQFNILNATDVSFIGSDFQLAAGNIIDNFGRRFQVSVTSRF